MAEITQFFSPFPVAYKPPQGETWKWIWSSTENKPVIDNPDNDIVYCFKLPEISGYTWHHGENFGKPYFYYAGDVEYDDSTFWSKIQDFEDVETGATVKGKYVLYRKALYKPDPCPPALPQDFHTILPKLPTGAEWKWDFVDRKPYIDYSGIEDISCIDLPDISNFQWYYDRNLQGTQRFLAGSPNNADDFSGSNANWKTFQRNIKMSIDIDPDLDMDFNSYFLYSTVENPDFAGCTPPPAPLTKFVTSYKITDVEIMKLFESMYPDPSNAGWQQLQNNVLKYYILPYDIDVNDFKTDTEKIVLGTTETIAEGNLITNEKLKIHLGDITVSRKYKNVWDYKDTNCTLYIPFGYPIKLDIQKIMGITFRVDLFIDTMTGISDVVITDVDNNIIIDIVKANISKFIPMKLSLGNDVIGSIEVSGAVSEVDKIQLVINRKKPYIGIEGASCYNEHYSECVEMSLLTGFVRVKDIRIDTWGLEKEVQEIKMLMKQGVYI